MTKLELLEKLKSLGDNDSVDDIISIKESDYKDDLKDLADKAGGTFNPEGVKVKKPTSVDEVPEQAKDLYRKMHEDDELDLIAKDIYQTLKESDTPEANGLAKLFSLADIRSKMDKNADWRDNRTIDAFYDDLMEQARGRWHELDELNGLTDSVLFDKDENGNKIKPDDWSDEEWEEYTTNEDKYDNDEDNFNGEIIDANGDGDPDVAVEDDSATVVADDPKEAKEGVKAAKESLAGSFAEGNDLFNTFDKATSKDKLEQDSTGSLNDKPQEETSDIRKKRVEKMSNSWGATNTQKKKADCTVSDENEKDKKHPADCSCSECKKSKDQELSDFRFKNILGALQDKLW